jgi:hypothetical protein
VSAGWLGGTPVTAASAAALRQTGSPKRWTALKYSTCVSASRHSSVLSHLMPYNATCKQRSGAQCWVRSQPRDIEACRTDLS